MVKENETAEKKCEEAQAENPPALPKTFFKDLLSLPACKLGKPCDNCGKCER